MAANIKSRQLGLLLNDFELLSKTVLTQLHLVIKLLEKNDIKSLYDEVEENEIIIDRLEVKIREEVVFSIFQFNPIASDLRIIIGYQDMTTNLERIGDMLLNIAHFLRKTDFTLAKFEEYHRLITKMLDAVTEMTRDAIFSFSNQDSNLAYKVIEKDDEIDNYFHKINTNLQTSFSETALSKEELKNILNINAIAQNLERIGDNATNIGEATIYLTDGKDIRHGNNE